MAEGAAILAYEGLAQYIGPQGFRIDLFVGSSWQEDVAIAGVSDLSRSENTLTIDEDVDYLNDSGSTQTATQARVRAFNDGVWTSLPLFPAGSIGSIELVDGQILRFTNISCDLND